MNYCLAKNTLNPWNTCYRSIQKVYLPVLYL